ncbi:MAG: hypothetical protein ACI857_003019, partial [Arenicella sp.]
EYYYVEEKKDDLLKFWWKKLLKLIIDKLEAQVFCLCSFRAAIFNLSVGLEQAKIPFFQNIEVVDRMTNYNESHGQY